MAKWTQKQIDEAVIKRCDPVLVNGVFHKKTVCRVEHATLNYVQWEDTELPQEPTEDEVKACFTDYLKTQEAVKKLPVTDYVPNGAVVGKKVKDI